MTIDELTNSRGISFEALTGIEKFSFIAEQKKALANPVDSSNALREFLAEQERQRKMIADLLEPPYMREIKAQQARMKQLLDPCGINELLAKFESPIERIYKQSALFGYREALERIQENHNRMMQGVIALRDVLERKKAKPPLILPRIQSLTAWLASLKAWIDLLIGKAKHAEIFGIESIDTERKVISAELF